MTRSSPEARTTSRPGAPRGGAVWAALIAVYIVWGSTYLAIRVTVRTIPPLTSASLRFLIAGAVLYLWAVRRGDREGDKPTARHWWSALVIGAALPLGGNGLVSLAEQTVPSGVTSLVIATIPLWMVLIRRGLGERVGWREALGLALGFGGVVLLLDPFGGGTIDPLGAVLLLMAAVSWAAGSIYARTARLPDRPLVGTGMEMLAGGALLAVVSAAAGEWVDVDLAAVSVESWLGLAFLIVFGSWVGFACYVWLLRVARTSFVSTYAYVNPVVAVALGVIVLGEALTVRSLLAGAVIVAGVALIVSAAPERAQGEPASAAPPGEEDRVPA